MKYVSNQRSLHNVEVTLSIHIYLGAPSLAIACASTLQIRYNGHNSGLRPQRRGAGQNTKYQQDKCKIPAGQIQNTNYRELNWLSLAPAYESPRAQQRRRSSQDHLLERRWPMEFEKSFDNRNLKIWRHADNPGHAEHQLSHRKNFVKRWYFGKN